MDGHQVIAKQWVKQLKTHLTRDNGEGFNDWERDFVTRIKSEGPWSKDQLIKIEQVLDRVLRDWGDI